MVSEQFYLTIIGGITFPSVAFIVGHVMKIINKAHKRVDEVEKKSNEIVMNYLSRFDEIKTMINALEMKMHQQHGEVMEIVHFMRSKINEQQQLIDNQNNKEN